MKQDVKRYLPKNIRASTKRLQLEDALKYMREGDTLVIWKLTPGTVVVKLVVA